MNKLIDIFYNKTKRKSTIILVAYVGLMILSAVFFSKYVNKDALQVIVENSGRLGAAVYFLIEVLYVTFTPLLNSFVLIASGYIFGGHMGFVMNFLANIAGSFLIIFLVQKYGRPLLHRVVSPRLYQEFDNITQKVGPLTLMIVYALPFTPDDELTYLVAAGPIGAKRFVLPIVIGNLGKAAYSYIGDAGFQGVSIALYSRLAALFAGIIIVGLQEHFIKKHNSKINIKSFI